MANPVTVHIGLIGFGTVGSGVVKALRANGAVLAKRLGVTLNLKTIVDLDIQSDRGVDTQGIHLSTNVRDIFDDPQIDIVVELIGGNYPAQEFITEAMRAKKHVVTANKALLAEQGYEIFSVAKECNADLYFEAAVAGGIPVIKALREGLVINQMNGITGILNGTANYILTHMRESQRGFDEILHEAQAKGYAEADPSFDIEGTDTAHKIAILASIASGTWVDLSQVYVEGITHLTLKDIQYADELGYRIKLLGIFKRIDNGTSIQVRVHPAMIPLDNPLANVEDVFNGIYLDGDIVGRLMFYGRGAGQLPTASAVVSDIVDIALNIKEGVFRRVPALDVHSQGPSVIPMDEVMGKSYLRFTVEDAPGVLARIAGILGQHHISINTVLQKEMQQDGVVPVVMMISEAKECNVRKALKEIDELGLNKGPTVRIRVEDLL